MTIRLDLIDRDKLESNLDKCETVNYYDKDDEYVGYFEADTVYSCVRNASKVDAVPIEVLDKIREEIEQMDFDFGDFYDHTNTIREMVLEVIDKYKAERKEV